MLSVGADGGEAEVPPPSADTAAPRRYGEGMDRGSSGSRTAARIPPPSECPGGVRGDRSWRGVKIRHCGVELDDVPKKTLRASRSPTSIARGRRRWHPPRDTDLPSPKAVPTCADSSLASWQEIPTSPVLGQAGGHLVRSHCCRQYAIVSPCTKKWSVSATAHACPSACRTPGLPSAAVPRS